MMESTAADPVLPPAPGAEQYLALDFANSAIALPGDRFVDLLGSSPAATRWLVERELAPADIDLKEMCTARLRSLREHVRALLSSHVEEHPPLADSLVAVNDALTRSPTASLLHWDAAHGPHRAAAHPTTQTVDHALALVASSAADLLTGTDSERLTACGSPPCNRFFLRRGRRHWCSTRCGDRVRAARAYARRTTAPT